MTDDQEAACRAAEQLAQQLSDVLHVVVSPSGGKFAINEADARWLVQRYNALSRAVWGARSATDTTGVLDKVAR